MSNDPTFRRGLRNSGYTNLSNRLLEDLRISAESRWLVAYLLSKPEGWILRLTDIRNKVPCGRDKAYKLIKEIVDSGWASRDMQRAGGQFKGVEYVVHDQPIMPENKESEASPFPENTETVPPFPDLPYTANTVSGKSGHIVNTDSLVTPDSLVLRESARETDLEEDQIEGDALSLKKRTDMFTRILQGWFPASGSPKEAQAVWERLSDADCMAAADKFQRWKNDWITSGHTYKLALSTFLRERRWTEVPDGPAEPAKSHHTAKPLGKLWNVWRLRLLLLGPAARMPAHSAYIQGLIDKGGTEGQRWRMRHLALNGYPEVNTMLEQAGERRGHSVPVGFEHLAERCRQCNTQSDLFAAWQAEHEKRGWPLIEVKGVEWIWLPVPGQPDDYTEPAAFVAAALEELETALKALGEEGHQNDERAA